MYMEKSIKHAVSRLLMAAVALVLLPTGALAGEVAAEDNTWQFGASIYGWFPDIAGQTAFTPPGGSGEFEVDIDSILENLKFTLMGTFDARKGRWGVVTDFVYMDVGGSTTGSRELTIEGEELPADVTADIGLDLKSLILNLAGSYRVLDKPSFTMDMIAGARYVDIEQKLNWNLTGDIGGTPLPAQSGNATVSVGNLDGIVGVRGRLAFGAKKALFVPYELDIGTGDSDFTWQGATGVGYSFGWWQLAAVWRYLYYDLSSDSAIKDMSFGGPAVGAVFRW